MINDSEDICNICKSNKADEDNPLLRLCDCNIYKHFNCLKKELEKIKIRKTNKNGNAINYYIKLHCNDCQKQLPLRFKINKTYELIDIERPKNENIEKPKNEEYLLL